MPFYYMRLSAGTIRFAGFANTAFEVRTPSSTQAEYRWEIWSGLDAAVVLRLGEGGRPPGRPELRGPRKVTMASDSASTPTAPIIFRVDAGFGSRDGKHLYIVWGGVF